MYFIAADVDEAYRKAMDLGARGLVAPQEYPGGKFAVISDPQGASFGLITQT